MSYPNAKAAISDFAFRLRRARRDAGELSLRELAQRMKFRGSASTLQRAFAGNVLPAWPLVEALLESGCGVPAETVRSEWLPCWVAAKDVVDPLDEPDVEYRDQGSVNDTPSLLQWRRKRA